MNTVTSRSRAPTLPCIDYVVVSSRRVCRLTYEYVFTPRSLRTSLFVKAEDDEDEEQMDYEGRFLDRGDRVLRIDDDEQWGVENGQQKLAEGRGAAEAAGKDESDVDEEVDEAEDEAGLSDVVTARALVRKISTY